MVCEIPFITKDVQSVVTFVILSERKLVLIDNHVPCFRLFSRYLSYVSDLAKTILFLCPSFVQTTEFASGVGIDDDACCDVWHPGFPGIVQRDFCGLCRSHTLIAKLVVYNT